MQQYISSKAQIDANVMIGENARIYGNAIIGVNSIVEHSVTIGHPHFEEMSSLNIGDYDNLDSMYDAASTGSTLIGAGSIVRSNTVIYNHSRIGERCDCGHNVIVRENCVIGNDVYLFVNTELKREVQIGNDCRLAGTICDRTRIGDFSSMLGHTVHKYLIGVGGYREEAPVVGRGVLVGREAVLIGGITVADFSVIASNSVLTQSIPERSVFAGIPAQFVKYRAKDQTKIIQEYMDNAETRSSAK